MNPLNACPNHDQLLALHQGELNIDTLEAVCQHLASCESCEVFLANIQEAKEGVVGNLRQFLHHEPWINHEEFQAVEARAKAISLEGPLPFRPANHSDAAPAEQVILTPLGKYEILHVLGQGGMGVVYAAKHTKLNRKVAVKVISPEHSANGRVRARFLREMKAIGELSHVNVVAATDADEVEGRPYLVMELVEGFNLDALLRLCGPLPLADACEIIRQAAVGLQYVHEHHRIHRDLKPSNLMLSKEAVVKILDLGLTRIFSEGSQSEELTRSQAMMGTADFMAPEQWEDSHNADIRADIYSLGCTLYKLLAGNAPFSDPEFKPTPKKKLAHTQLQVPPLRSRRPEVPAAVAAVVERMLEKDPAQRYATPIEVANALAPFAEGNDCRQLIAAATRRLAELPEGQAAMMAGVSDTVGHKKTPYSASSFKERGIAKRVLRKRRVVIGVCILTALLGVVVLLGLLWRDRPNEPMVPGRWYYPLRDGNITLLAPLVQRGRHSFHLDRQLDRLDVFSPGLSLISLGTTDSMDYILDLEIKQTPLTGNFGVFFGYHPDSDFRNGKPCFKFQILEVKSDLKKGKFAMGRRWALIEPVQGEFDMGFNSGFGSAKLNPPFDATGYHLEIEVRQGRLRQVLWNKQRLEFIGDEIIAKVTEADYVGQFGTFNQGSQSVFSNIRFMICERKTP
jgi:hypothetical protein